MAEAVAGLLTSALVGIAIDKLRSAIAEQSSLLWNFGEDLEDMMDVLEAISAALEDAERRSIKEKLVQLWLKRLKNVATDISEMLDDYKDTSDIANGKKTLVLSCIPSAYKMISIANKMKGLRKDLKKIDMQFGNFNFVNTQGTSSNVQHYDKFETTSYFSPEVEGREGEKQEIINLLHASSNHDESETVIVSIYALGGMGKTTLAQLVYNDDQFKKQYDCHVWVYVSQDFNLLSIGNKIISQLQEGAPHNRDFQNADLQVIMQCLDNILCSKKVLIVLDDLWEKDDTELCKLKSMLRVGKKGSTIDVIVTTREEGIARSVTTSNLYKLQPLKDDMCWKIIKRSSMCNQKEFEKIGLDIAKKCRGVPLAAQALGFILRSKDISEWNKINDSDIWNETSDDRVLPSLRLSYQRMPQQLRICFSYCAIFSKGHNIVEDDLIHQWSVLGFIETSMKGKQYINHLLGMSFLQVSKMPLTSGEHLARYTMHDLVHDLARSTMADELIVFDVAPRRNTPAHKYCRYSLLRKHDRKMKLANMPSKMLALRFADSGELLNVPCRSFSFAKFLRTLDFSECPGILLPVSIGRLKHLRCLIAPRMLNENLPECITKLSKLQYLNISGSSKITELTEPLCGLTQLQYLNLSSCESLERLPEATGSLMGLQHLNMSSCRQIRELPESLMKLQNLLHLDLSGCRRMQHLGGVRGLTALQHLNMSRLWDIHLQDLSNVMTNLTNLRYLGLRNLIISGPTKNATSIPDWIGGLINLEQLDLSLNTGLTGLPECIGNLKRLHTLDLSKCWELKYLPETIGTLELKSLVLNQCSNELLDWASFLVHYSQILPVFKVHGDDVNGSSNLHLLNNVHVSEMKIRSLENVRYLEEANKVKLLEKHNLSKLTLSWTVDAVRLVEDNDLLGQLVPPRGLKRMSLKGYNGTRFPAWLMAVSHHLTNLVSIYLRDLPTCSNLPPLGQLPHLENLKLCNLPCIKRIDREFCGGKGAFHRLLSFSITYMDCLEEWHTTYSVEDGVEEFMFPVLDTLEIDVCPKLRLKPCPPTFRECCISWSDQVIFSLEELDKTSHHRSANRAIKLHLGRLGDSCQSIRLFHHFPLLRELTIVELKSLSESMRHLSSLESLTFQRCYSISALPEWLGDLSSLKSLVILGCHGIKSLPACIKQLTKLQKLEIRESPELKKWCESEENKMKLAHINNIQPCHRFISWPAQDSFLFLTWWPILLPLLALMHIQTDGRNPLKQLRGRPMIVVIYIPLHASVGCNLHGMMMSHSFVLSSPSLHFMSRLFNFNTNQVIFVCLVPHT